MLPINLSMEMRESACGAPAPNRVCDVCDVVGANYAISAAKLVYRVKYLDGHVVFDNLARNYRNSVTNEMRYKQIIFR